MVPAQPLAVPGAMTQGLLGSLLARSIDLLRGHGTAAALVTNVIVSEIWRDILAEEYGTQAEVVHNGVDVARFAAADLELAAALRKRAGAESRPLILSVGGIEPRKGSDTLMKSVAELREGGRRPVLAVVGGHSFQDYREYRDRVLASIPDLGLRLGDDVVLPGTCPTPNCPSSASTCGRAGTP